MKNKKIAIILTACVNPNGMSQTVLQDSTIRKSQYLTAIRWYLLNTTIPIVVVENTGYDFSYDFKDFSDSARIEFLSFKGNDYDKSKGKGFGEGLILKYAFDNSRLLSNCDAFIKITGRFIVSNVNRIIRNSLVSTKNWIISDVTSSHSVIYSIKFDSVG